MIEDKLEYILKKQKLLQEGMMRHHDYGFIDKYDAVARNARWCMQEIAEMLQELKGYDQPWKSKDIDIKKIKEEAIDALHFFLNIFIFLDMDAEEIIDEYNTKFQKNVHRLLFNG